MTGTGVLHNSLNDCTLWISAIANQTSFARFTTVWTSSNTNNQGGTESSNNYEPHQNPRCLKNDTKQVLRWESTNIKGPPNEIHSSRPPDDRNWSSLAAAAAATDDDDSDDDIIQMDRFSSKVDTEIFHVWVSVHHKSILYKELTRCNFGSIVY